MINGFIKGQALTLASPVIASGTIDYLTIRFTFLTNEWDNLDQIWVHFRQGDKVFDAQVVDGRVKEDEHINLTEGEWDVYLHGNTFEGGEVIQRITTEPQTLKVVASGKLDGEPFPTVKETTAEKILAVANEAKEKATEAIEAVADVQIQKGIQSLTAFPEIAKEGDVILLHRCNEISADDSNSGIILDPVAVASLKLPEGITNRRWEFVNTTPNGADFELVLEQVRIDEDVPYVLTSIYLFSKTYADRWYWKDGEPYTEIPETSTKPVPGYIPLGVITDFTATKSPMRGDEVWDVEDTDPTVIFRTAPREYIYTNGGWKLTERTDAAEGSIIAEVKPVVRNGQNFLELRLTDSRGFKMGQRKKYIYIPVESVKETGGINQQSVELIFPTAGTGGIKSVSALPTVANEDDVVYYCPPPNRLTAADSGHKVYLNNKWVNECPVFGKGDNNHYLLKLSGTSAGSIKFDKSEEEAKSTLSKMSNWNTIVNIYKNINGVYSFSSADSFKRSPDSEIGKLNVPFDTLTITLPDFDTFEVAEEIAPEYVYFTAIPRFYRYTNGEWVELPYSEPEQPNKVDCELTDTSLNYGILPNILYRFGEVDMLNLDLLLSEADKVDEYKFSFISGETATLLTLPDDVVWAGGKAFEAVPNAQYTVTVLNGVASFETTAKDKIWIAIDEIRGGIDEIEAMIDESGVLDE